MIKKVLITSLFVFAALRANDTSLAKFKQLDRHSQHAAIIALAVDGVTNFQTALTQMATVLPEPSTCRSNIAFFLENRITAAHNNDVTINPFTRLLANHNDSNVNFPAFFTQERIQSLAAALNTAPNDVLQTKYVSVAIHLLQLHKQARRVVAKAQQVNNDSHHRRFSSWLADTLHSDNSYAQFMADPFVHPQIATLYRAISSNKEETEDPHAFDTRTSHIDEPDILLVGNPAEVIVDSTFTTAIMRLLPGCFNFIL